MLVQSDCCLVFFGFCLSQDIHLPCNWMLYLFFISCSNGFIAYLPNKAVVSRQAGWEDPSDWSGAESVCSGMFCHNGLK